MKTEQCTDNAIYEEQFIRSGICRVMPCWNHCSEKESRSRVKRKGHKKKGSRGVQIDMPVAFLNIAGNRGVQSRWI